MKKAQKKIGKSSDGREMHYSVGVMLSHNRKYLMMDRRNPPPGFACPAGHVDEGEEPQNATLREVFEETKIKLKDVEFVLEEEVPWNYCRTASAHYWYLFKAEAPTSDLIIDEREAKSLRWYTIDEIKKLKLEPVWKYWFEKLKII